MMRIGIIGRSSLMMNTINRVVAEGFQISFIITSKEAPEYTYSSSDFREMAEKLGCPFLHLPSFKGEAGRNFIASCLKTDICLSVNYSGVIPSEIINLFPLGILNAHLGDLPRYRGNATGAWAILNGEEKVGLCIHKMIGGELDSGDIVCRSYHNNDGDLRIGQLYDWMDTEIPELYIRALTKLQEPLCKLEVQDKDPASSLRTFPRQPTDGRVNFVDSALTIHRLVNASSEPFGGAFAFINGKKIIIWRTSIVYTEDNLQYIPGQVIEINRGTGSVTIGCTDNTFLMLHDVEIDGVRGLPAEFIRSIRSRLA